jgi:outer membrane protein assembly factor BamE (lipoprotein component of BamABCDE complex)
LEKKQSSLVVNETNKNDIKKILGNPSTKSKFDNDVWIYIERKQTQSGFKKNSFIYDFMSSMRQKINDPLGQRAKKRKKITQR